MTIDGTRKWGWRLLAEGVLVACTAVALVSHVALANATHLEEATPEMPTGVFSTAWQWMVAYAQKHGMDERMVFCLGLFVAHTGTFTIMNAGLAVIDHFGLCKQYKIQPDAYPEWSLIKEALAHQAVSQLIIAPVAAYLLYPYTAVAAGMSIFGPLPSFSTVAWQLAVSFVVNDTLFYFAHRLLHHRSIYRFIHKEHHRFRVTIGIASEFAHPLEEIVGNIIPTMIGPFLVGAHFSVLLLWLFLRLVETIDTHSGYQFPWSITQLMDGAKRHDYHHSHNVGMYGGILLFWDWVFGTDKPYLVHEAKMRTKKLA